MPDLVSVITTSYNTGAFLRETIESVLAQTHAPIEMIVVDDGSTDSTWEIVRSFGTRVTGIRQANAGQSRARGRGVAAASGRFLLFLDADDVLSPEMLASGVELLRGSPKAIAASKWRRLAKRGPTWVPVSAEIPLPEPGVDPLDAWLRGSWFPICSLVWPREVYESLGGWDDTLTCNEDGDLVLRALAGGVRLALTRDGETFYRTHGDALMSISADIVSEHRFRSRMRVLEKLTVQLQGQGTLARYAEPLGIAWQRLALIGFEDHAVLARECLRRGQALAGKRTLSRTLLGRMLTWMVGLERKEAMVQTLAHYGISTGERRRYVRLRRIQARVDDGTAPSDHSSGIRP